MCGRSPEERLKPLPQQKERAMPLIRVELFDYRVTPEVSEKLIAEA